METGVETMCVITSAVEGHDDGGEDSLVLRSEDVNESTDQEKPEVGSTPDEFLFDFFGGEEVVETFEIRES